MSNIKAEGDYIIVEKVDYEEEKVSEGGIIYKESQVLSSSFVESRIISMGEGLPLLDGTVPPVGYDVGDVVIYDARARIGTHNKFDVIRREGVIGVVDETK